MKELNIKKILIPLDFSFTSMKALEQAVVLAKLTDAEITLVHIIENIYVTTEPAYYSIPISESYESQLMK